MTRTRPAAVHSVEDMQFWTGKTWLVSSIVTAVIAVGGVAGTLQESDAVAPASARTAATSAAPEEVAQPSPEAVAGIETDARFSVSVIDLDTAATLTYGEDTFDTASIVKVDILAALLRQHQEDGTELDAAQRALATAMIERSDNAAASALFEAVGGKTGLEAFNQAIGLADTVVGDNGNWGLTRTTSRDQIKLLQVVFGDDSVLSSASQAYMHQLMSNVIESQNFGVSAAADDPDESALKVGYLQRSATGLWDVTSIGRIEANGHTYLVSVLSDSSTSFTEGVALVDVVARTAVASMTAI